MAQEPGSIDDILGAFSEYKKLFSLSGSIETVSRLYDEINKVNRTFTEGRLRAVEFGNAVTDSVAGVVRVGGDVNQIGQTIIDIAAGARRNIVATTETIVELTAASRALGNIPVESLAENFSKVGFDISNIAENIEDSLSYIQSIGLNATTVFGDVSRNMEMMNRFNFEGGVVGLTKMAAQASMLRFDMNRTAEFADKVLNPEGAIEMAAAFQRLGVAAGDLVDPFVLMDKSINDPEGLQDSLIEMSKQFTYFDEKTNSFRINPGGVRLMKELAETTGIQFSEMSKTAIAAADLDRRLSEIDFSIDASEEDKMLVANMAKMGEGGQYFVELSNEEGRVEQKRLQDLTQNEFERLREVQETRPKTMEDIARAQLTTNEMVARDIKALPMQLAYAIAGQSGVIRLTEATRRASDTAIGGAYGEGVLPSGREFRQMFEGVGDALKNTLFQAMQGDMGAFERAYEMINVENISESVQDRVRTYLDNLEMKGGPRNPEEDFIQKQMLDRIRSLGGSLDGGTTTTTIDNNVNFNGGFTIRVEGQPGLDTKALTDYVNSESFKQKMTMVIQEEMQKQNKPLKR
jgi:hypothetical protein